MSLYVKYVSAPKLVQENMTVSSDDGQLGNPARLSAGFPSSMFSVFPDTPYATLEPRGWLLDGTRDVLPDDPENIGWWSKEVSDEYGVFDGNKPVLRLLFPEDQTFSAPGITFLFWPSTEEWCNEVSVSWYCNDEMIDSAIENPDSAVWYLDHPVENFNCIEVELISTNIPGHFAKLQQIQIGQTVLFFQDELVRVSLLHEVDPSACELSADELTVEIRDSKNRKLNIRKDQRLDLYRNDEIIASHYIKDYTREGENKLALKAQSAISVLEDTFLGGFYDNESVLYALSTIFENGFSWDLDLSLYNKTISGYLPVCTKREALQQIAFAIGAYVTTWGDGTIRIVAVGDTLTDQQPGYFDKDKILSGSSLAQLSPPKGIQVTAHKYTKIEETEDLAEVSLPDKSEGKTEEVICVFSEPHWGYSYSLLTPEQYSSFSYEEHDNWVRIIGQAGTAVKVTGKKYVHTTLENSWTNPEALDFGDDTIKVENATLITKDNVEDAITRLKNYHSLTNSLNGTVVVDKQKAGGIVEIANPFGNDLTVGYITKMESEFTATGHTASIEVRGAERLREDAEVLKQ